MYVIYTSGWRMGTYVISSCFLEMCSGFQIQSPIIAGPRIAATYKPRVVLRRTHPERRPTVTTGGRHVRYYCKRYGRARKITYDNLTCTIVALFPWSVRRLIWVRSYDTRVRARARNYCVHTTAVRSTVTVVVNRWTANEKKNLSDDDVRREENGAYRKYS